MKKLVLGAVLLTSFVLQARTLTVTTTCGTVSNINVSDNATLDQIKTAVEQHNINQCGVLYDILSPCPKNIENKHKIEMKRIIDFETFAE